MPAARVHVLPEERATSPVSDTSSLASHLTTDWSNSARPRAPSPGRRLLCDRHSSTLSIVARSSPSPSHSGAPGPELSPYERLLHGLHHDERWLKEVTLGKRVGLYRFRGDLGSGNFSQVKLAIHQLTRERVAIKMMDKNRLDEKTRKMLAREIATMESLHHPNIIRLYEVVETYTRIHLVTEFASGGELYSRVTQAGRLAEIEARPLFAQLVSAVHYMHERNFIHRDLKAENVLFSGFGWNVKVVDFGFSTQLSAPDQRLSTFCGSPPYAAPELFRDEWYNGAPVDVWALGVLLYFMVSGTMPFRAHTVAGLKRHILEGEFPDPSPSVTPQCLSVIHGLMRPVPSERTPLKQLLNSCDWLNGVSIPEPSVLSAPPSKPEDEAVAQEIYTEARKRLSHLGITSELLKEANDKGARSAVTGSYRIIAHRVERELTGIPESDESQMLSPTESSHSKTSPPKQGIFKRVLKSPMKHKNRMSKTCSVL